MTNSVLYITKNCELYNQAMADMKVLYIQGLRKRKQEGRLKSKNELLKAAVIQEKEKKYSREAAETYGNVAMLYELEDDVTHADIYFKKSLGAYPIPMMMAFYNLLQTQKK